MNFFDADRLAGEDGAEVDLFPPQTDPAAIGGLAYGQEEIDAGRASDRLAKERCFETASSAPAAAEKKAGRGFWQKLKRW